MSSQFVHLHLHSHFSTLDGANRIEEIIDKAISLGQPAIALTDHGNMHGAIDLLNIAGKTGIRPIVGCEVYLTTDDMQKRVPVEKGGSPTHHLTLLAMNLQGYRNLCFLVTKGFTHGFYFKPRIDHELLFSCHEGIICLSGCLSSEFAFFARRGDERGAMLVAQKYESIFGNRFYLEIQPHGIDEQGVLNQIARSVGNKLGIPLVATNDCHYLEREDKLAQEVLICVGTNKLLSDSQRMKHEEGVNLHLKSREEMEREMPEDLDALDASVELASRCELTLDFSSYHMPSISNEADMDSLFCKRSRKGLKKRFLEMNRQNYVYDEREYRDRLEEEIETILSMGFAGYFLVVADFIVWAKERGIPVGPGRGSAAGSLVAYSLQIFDIDPIRYDLLFERFLNPERISMPDIDVDFCIHGRQSVINYVSEKYGRDRVAQICTFGTLKAKAAIRDVGRVLGFSYVEMDRVAKLVPAPRQGFDYPLKEALRMEPQLADYAKEEGKELISLAIKLEGLVRHSSTHAAGVVISPEPLVNYLPLMLDKDGQIVTQYSMNQVEKIGLAKFDFLGLKTLSVIKRAVDLIKEDIGDKIDLNALPLEDKKTYEIITKGQTTGIFQLESSGITEMVKRLKPSCFEDIVDVIALYRPGPLDSGMAERYISRKHGREKVEVAHPMLEDILSKTWGIILYQEQIMQIARDMAGYTLGEADVLRHAMGKKKPAEMAVQREVFIKGAKSKGIDFATAKKVFDQMETFARYGFNRSHSVAYAMISFQTAWLKAHYPLYFLSALMSFEKSDTDKTLKNLNECKNLKIGVLPPDLNRSEVDFSVDEEKILFALSAIKGVGEKVMEESVAERKKNGPYKNMLDFCLRIEEGVVNRRVLESLVYSGAFDWEGLSRAELSARVEDVLKYAQVERARKNSLQSDMFFRKGDSPREFTLQRDLLLEWPSVQKLAREKEALGLYLSGHPLEQYRELLSPAGITSISDLENRRDRSQVMIAGAVTFLKLKNTKKGDRYATFKLEDLSGTVEVIIWPNIYKQVSEILDGEAPIYIEGITDVNDERVQIIGRDVAHLSALEKNITSKVTLMLKESHCEGKKLRALVDIIKSHRGSKDLKIHVAINEEYHAVLAAGSDNKIELSQNFKEELESLFGESLVSIG